MGLPRPPRRRRVVFFMANLMRQILALPGRAGSRANVGYVGSWFSWLVRGATRCHGPWPWLVRGLNAACALAALATPVSRLLACSQLHLQTNPATWFTCQFWSPGDSDKPLKMHLSFFLEPVLDQPGVAEHAGARERRVCSSTEKLLPREPRKTKP